MADAPTRLDELGVAFLESIGSVFVLPKLPGWLTSQWLPPCKCSPVEAGLRRSAQRGLSQGERTGAALGTWLDTTVP